MGYRLSKYLIGLGALAAGLIMQTSGPKAGDVIGWMDIEPKGAQIAITGRAYAQHETDIDFTLQIERIGQSGKTATKQGGRAALSPGKVAKLSTSSINVAAEDGLAILLTISRAGQIISSSAVHVGKE